MHLNTHTGRNVHTCPYCNIQFVNRQSYESHIKLHAPSANSNGGLNIANDSDNDCQVPQIVSVKSINTFDNETHEEIQIEPDIIADQVKR